MHATPFPLEPDPVPELLEQLVAQPLRCLYCADPIHRIEMFVAWPAGGIVAHFGCYAAAQNLVRGEATS